MFSTQPVRGQNGPPSRKQFRRVMNAIARANAPGKEGRIEAAAAKRLRKNAKRLADHVSMLVIAASSLGFI